jgi:acyl-CoA thioester hydrolase
VSASGEIAFRVRYCECDPMGVAHHSAFPVWFEMGRTELLRESETSYRDLEAAGIFIAVVKLSLHIRRPARYDDLLRLRTTLEKAGHVKLEHSYELFRGGDVLATGSTVLACLDRDGRARPLPEDILMRIG